MIMPSVHLRDVPKPVLDALKRRAKAHHRSLQGELHAIIEEAAFSAPPAEGYRPLRLHLSASQSQAPWVREDLYDDRGR